MSKGKKYDYRVVQEQSGWAAEIVRRATASKTVVSKRQGGFATESEADAWGQGELQVFSQNLNARNKLRAGKRKQP